MTADTIARLKITLDHVEPAVLRRIEVPLDIRLDRLHLILQAAIGWTNSHLYEIRARDVGWSTPLPDQDWAGEFLDARKAKLGDVLARNAIAAADHIDRTLGFLVKHSSGEQGARSGE